MVNIITYDIIRELASSADLFVLLAMATHLFYDIVTYCFTCSYTQQPSCSDTKLPSCSHIFWQKAMKPNLILKNNSTRFYSK